MAITFGFYNSLNGDRRYNAMDMSSLFDGIIRDGIFMSIGTSMIVSAAGGMMVKVGIGRAWFNHTWTHNDAELPLFVDPAEVLLNRIDAVVLEVDATEAVRGNTIKIVKGVAATNPDRPKMIKSEYVNQHALAYIYVKKAAVSIVQADITNMVGTSETPFITGVLQTMNIDALITQWGNQWDNWMNETMVKNEQWTGQQQEEFVNWANQTRIDFENYYNMFKSDMDAFLRSGEADFYAWFNNLQVVLDENVAANLQNQINVNTELEFNRYYGLISKNTVVNKNTDGIVVSIVESSSDGTSTTTFSESGNKKTIVTALIPSNGFWNYTKTTEITKNNNNVIINETFTKTGK